MSGALNEVHDLDVLLLELCVHVPVLLLHEVVVVLPGPVCSQVGVVGGRRVGHRPNQYMLL